MTDVEDVKEVDDIVVVALRTETVKSISSNMMARGLGGRWRGRRYVGVEYERQIGKSCRE